MRCFLLTCLVLLTSTLASAWAKVPLQGSACTVVFASVEEGRGVLGAKDEYVEKMSPFDRAARLKTDREVSAEEYMKSASGSVVAWDESEKALWTEGLQKVAAAIAGFRIKLPETVLLIKTTGDEEGNAPYTRANAIILPARYMHSKEIEVFRVLSHELFHIISRTNPELREKLYRLIGFEKCTEVFPPSLLARKITNPDAPRNEYCIRLARNGQAVWAVPILYSSSEKYDLAKGGDFFEYLEFKFQFVERSATGEITGLVGEPMEPGLFEVRGISGLLEQVGRNTAYLIHPEEILADNFALLTRNRFDVPTPELLEKMNTTLSEP